MGAGKVSFYSFDLGLPPFVTYLPTYGRAGAEVLILGQGFTDTSQVFFNGTPATFKIGSYSTYYEDHGAGWSHDRPDHRHHREWHTDQQQGVHCAPIDSHADATGHRALCIEARPHPQRLVIAVGTTIADCPPHRPGRALISASGSYLG